ncbi:MAG: AMP-binding protein [Alphaproteobacteria bacterium]
MNKPTGSETFDEWQGRSVLAHAETEDDRDKHLLHRYVERHAAVTPNHTAVTFADASWTYQNLIDAARQLASQLQYRGIGRGSRVVVCVAPCLEMPAAVLAIHMVGAVYIPLDPTYPQARIEAIVEELGPALALTDRQSTRLFEKTGVAREDLAALCRIDGEAGTPEPVEIDREDLAYIFYTSGTTGAPKGIAVSRRGLAFYVHAAIDVYGITAGDIMPAIAKFSFSISLFELMCPIVAGGSVVILERDHIMKPALLAGTLEQVTVVHMGPSLFGRTLDYIQSHNDGVSRFDHVHHASVGGDVAQPDLLETMKAVFPNAEICVIYGCSEVACMGCTYLVPRTCRVDRTYVGNAFPGAEVRLWREKDGEQESGDVPVGETGEVLFAGEGLLSDYIAKPELMAQKHLEIDGKRYFRTGDLGRFDSFGNLELLGRSDFQIKLRGMRIEPVEIEVQLRQADSVKEAVVAAAESEDMSKRLVAYVVPKEGATLDPSAIRAFLSRRLPDYMIPSAFVLMECLPLNQNLKVDRKALPPVSRDNLITLDDATAPRNDVERRLAEIWCAELGLDTVGVTSNFFDVGGDSLSATNVLMEIETAWGRTLSTDVFLQQPTIETLALVISGEAESGERGDIIQLREGAEEPPIFCLFGILTYRDLAQHLGFDRSVVCVAPKIEDQLFYQGDVEQIRAVFANFEQVAERYLTIVQRHRPHGPYILSGHSWGGVVALETARRLRALGEEVELVVLFDCNEPRFFKKTCQPNRVEAIFKALVSRTMTYLNHLMPKPPESGDRTDRRKYTGDSLRWEMRWDSTDGYRPDPYDGRVLMFKARDRSKLSVDDPRLGWGNILPTLEVHVVPGDHHSLLKAPNVETICSHLERALTRTQA